MTSGRYPRRIVCLTEETTETLYLLGEQDRIVGISGYTVRPQIARKEKPRISAFTSAKIEKILALKPDLVLGFSDLQADIAAELTRAALAVHIFNQRTVSGIFDMIAVLGGMIGVAEKAVALIGDLERGLADIAYASKQLARRPRVYFEEWDEPMISAIGWVSELIGIAGGENCFAELAGEPAAKARIIADPLEVVRRAPDIIVGSWCGKRFRPEQVCARRGWQNVPAVRTGHVVEVKSAEILQPGPAALTDGVRRLHAAICCWAESCP